MNNLQSYDFIRDAYSMLSGSLAYLIGNHKKSISCASTGNTTDGFRSAVCVENINANTAVRLEVE